MTKKNMEETRKMMMEVVGEGLEEVVLPEFGKIDERFQRMDGNMKKMKEELIEMFQRGQKSLSNRLEEMEVDMSEMRGKIAGVESNLEGMNGKMDQIVENNKDYGKRLDKVERIVKAN